MQAKTIGEISYGHVSIEPVNGFDGHFVIVRDSFSRTVAYLRSWTAVALKLAQLRGIGHPIADSVIAEALYAPVATRVVVRHKMDVQPQYVRPRTRLDVGLYQRWQAAHSSRDYALSDVLRSELRSQGVMVHTKAGGGYGWSAAHAS